MLPLLSHEVTMRGVFSASNGSRRPTTGACSPWLSTAFSGLALFQSGCATMSLEPAGTTERVVSTRQAQEAGEQVTPHVTEAPPVIQVQLDANCERRRYDGVETTEHYANVNKGATGDWLFGISGAALLGLGGYALVDASSTYPNDTSSRTYNPSGPGGDIALAVTSFLAGGTLLAIAAVDVVRAQHSEEKASTGERRGSVAGSCGVKPLANTPVRLLFANDQSLDATTDATGTAHFDATGIRWSRGATSSTTLEVAGKSPGVSIDLPQYVAWQQQRATGAAAAQAAASSALMDRARQDNRDTENAALDKIEPDIVALEKKPEPWGDVDIQRMDNSYSGLKSLIAHHDEGQAPPRLQQDAIRLDNLVPKYKRATALAEQRQQQAAAEEARREAAAQKQLVPVCINCCLRAYAGATRDHCEAACGSDVANYVGVWGSGQDRGKPFCK